MTLEELQAQFVELQEQYKNVQADLTNQATAYKQAQDKIKDLETLNQKLFVKVTQPPEEQEQDKPYVSKLLGEEYTKVLDKQEIEFIKEIEEEIN